MTSFKFTTETLNRFWYADFQRFVEEEYDWPGFDLGVMLDYPSNDSYFEYLVNGVSELEDVADAKIVEEWIATGETDNLDLGKFSLPPYYVVGEVQVRHILHRLFKEGKIPAGKYMMEYYW